MNSPSSHEVCRSPQADFDPVARIYRWAEYLAMGRLLTRVRNHFLPELRRVRRVLLLGDGDGRFCARLLSIAPSADALALDSSASMLALLQSRCASASRRLTTLHRSAMDLPLKADLSSVDLITSHFFLDCLDQTQLEHLTTQLALVVSPGCLWLTSDFAIPPRQPWRLLGKLYISFLYRAFRVLTRLHVKSLPDHAAALSKAGFTRLHHRGFARGLLYSEIWQLAPAVHEPPL